MRTSQDRPPVLRQSILREDAPSNFLVQACKSLSQVNGERSLPLVAIPVIDRKTQCADRHHGDRAERRLPLGLRPHLAERVEDRLLFLYIFRLLSYADRLVRAHLALDRLGLLVIGRKAGRQLQQGVLHGSER
jgi:hypothetical protein